MLEKFEISPYSTVCTVFCCPLYTIYLVRTVAKAHRYLIHSSYLSTLNRCQEVDFLSSAKMGPTQELAQNVSQRYGWSTVIERNDGFWTCTVTVGLNDQHRFVSSETCLDTTQERRKQGVAAASQAALDGLCEEIERHEAKPEKSLGEVFPQPINIYESNRETWDYFWKHQPAAVGIDTEGNQISPPVLVQISTDDYTIMEVPHNGRLSNDLSRLLSEDRIVKVFCDNYAHNDKRSLGLTDIPVDLTVGPVVDLEDMAAQLLGPVKVARGLPRIVTLCLPELNVRIGKPSTGRLKNVGRFAWIEQGKAPPLKSIYDLSAKKRQYAALDAWCTLLAYKRMREAEASR